MFPPAELPPVAVKSRIEVRRQGFRQEKLAFAQGTEWNRAGWICAFMEHGLDPIFSSVESWPESSYQHCKRETEIVDTHIRTYSPAFAAS
jgi:hypothetical protein